MEESIQHTTYEMDDIDAIKIPVSINATYGIEVPISFLSEIIPENLWKNETTWEEGLPCYKSLDGTKAIIRLCNPKRIGTPNLGYSCSWYNFPDEYTDLLNQYFGESKLSEDQIIEKLRSSDYSRQEDFDE